MTLYSDLILCKNFQNKCYPDVFLFTDSKILFLEGGEVIFFLCVGLLVCWCGGVLVWWFGGVVVVCKPILVFRGGGGGGGGGGCTI